MDNIDSYQGEKLINNTKTFFSSNTLVANLVFLILVIICFILLLRLGTLILSYIFNPKPNVMLVNGLLEGSKQTIIPGDPKIHGSIPILRSRNQYDGIEFTWANWLLINGSSLNSTSKKFRHVFHKGNLQLGEDGIFLPNNGPGLYISPNNNPDVAKLSLLIRMNFFNNSNNGIDQENTTCEYSNSLTDCKKDYPYLNQSVDGAISPNIYEDIIIPDIPINKWISVIIRCENNNILDIYINGNLVRRHQLSGIVRQNYDDVNVAMNGGFDGYISDLRYFNYAIGTAEIDWIVENGPNLKVENSFNSITAKPYYLADRWYYDELDPVYSPSF